MCDVTLGRHVALWVVRQCETLSTVRERARIGKLKGVWEIIGVKQDNQND